MNAPLFRLNGKDFLRGLIVSVLTSFVTLLGLALQSGTIPTVVQLQHIGIVALAAGASYLVKNLFTNSSDQILKKEVAK